MTAPLALDLFCGQGGAARGLMRAGFETLGVDNANSVGRYYPGRFLHGDWRQVCDALRYMGFRPALVWASPPCQLYSITNAARQAAYPDLIGPVREYLLEWGVPFVLENVERAPLVDATTLCGTQFSLQTVDEDGERLYLRRHRLFEPHGFRLPQWDTNSSGWRCRCADFDRAGMRCAGVYGGGRTDKYEARNVRHGGYTPKSKAIRAALMGVDPDDFTLKGLSESIPPKYALWVAERFLAQHRNNESEVA